MQGEPKVKGDLVALQRGVLSEAAAREMLETIRWPDGIACVFCGAMEIGRIEGKAGVRKDGRPIPARHLYKCRACKKQFTVTKGTIFEDSKIPMQMWIEVMYRMCSSKKGISAYQIMREYGLSYEAAWFMCHRIRWSMTEKTVTPLSGTVEVDETYVGGKVRGHREQRIKKITMSEAVKAGYDKKTQVFGMLERGGRVRAQALATKAARISQRDVQATIAANVDAANVHVMSDEHGYYAGLSLPHDVIRHKSEYVRGVVHTQGIEGFWAGLKRQLIGTHHHVDAGYLNMYVQEQAYRYNARQITDKERFTALLGQVDGRLDWYVGKNAGEPS